MEQALRRNGKTEIHVKLKWTYLFVVFSTPHSHCHSLSHTHTYNTLPSLHSIPSIIHMTANERYTTFSMLLLWLYFTQNRTTEIEVTVTMVFKFSIESVASIHNAKEQRSQWIRDYEVKQKQNTQFNSFRLAHNIHIFRGSLMFYKFR